MAIFISVDPFSNTFYANSDSHFGGERECAKSTRRSHVELALRSTPNGLAREATILMESLILAQDERWRRA
jgi:hypothetical protein